MTVESIVDIIEQDLLVGHNHDELAAIRAIIHDAVIIIFSFRQRQYVCDAPVVKVDGYETEKGCLRPDDPCSYIPVDMDEPTTCVTDVFYQFLVHNYIHGGLAI